MKCVVARDNSNLQLNENMDKSIMTIINHRYVGDKFEYYVNINGNNKWMKESDIKKSNKLIGEYWYKLGINDKKESKIFFGSFNDDQECKNIQECKNNQNIKKRKCNNGNAICFDQPSENQEMLSDNIFNNESEVHDIMESDIMDNMCENNQKRKNVDKINDENIQEIENILECKKKKDGINYYLIKWVGSKVPTWITEMDFCERDALNEFHEFERLRNNPKNNKHRAYIYCRTSKRNNEREVSLYDQERVCMEFAKKYNIEVIGIFKDNGISAKNMEKQFALNHIINIIKRGECLLFYDVTRFSRSMHQAIEKLECMREEIGALAHSVHDKITWNNIASNRHNFRQILSTSQLHSEIVSEKVMSSFEYKKKRGDHVGHIPYGYKTEYIEGVKTLVKNENEIEVIKYIFEQTRYVCVQNNNTQTTCKKRNNQDCDQKFSGGDYKKFTELVNIKYTNRRKKPFTVQYVKKLLLEWKNKI